jgi:alkylation response protein AidB-like acyl-CoA dehydrogenase
VAGSSESDATEVSERAEETPSSGALQTRSAHGWFLQLAWRLPLMNEYLIARMYGDARVQRIYGGTGEMMKEVISRAL